MKNILVGYDGSEHAKIALRRAAQLAKETNRSIAVMSVVHVAPTGHGPAVEDSGEASERERELEEARSLLAKEGIDVELVEGHGDPGDALVAEAKRVGAELIVVGTRGRNLAERLLLGSVSTKVVHHATCDVLVVRR